MLRRVSVVQKIVNVANLSTKAKSPTPIPPLKEGAGLGPIVFGVGSAVATFTAGMTVINDPDWVRAQLDRAGVLGQVEPALDYFEKATERFRTTPSTKVSAPEPGAPIPAGDAAGVSKQDKLPKPPSDAVANVSAEATTKAPAEVLVPAPVAAPVAEAPAVAPEVSAAPAPAVAARAQEPSAALKEAERSVAAAPAVEGGEAAGASHSAAEASSEGSSELTSQGAEARRALLSATVNTPSVDPCFGLRAEHIPL